MDWCGSSTPRTPEYRTMNEERHERKAYWLVIVRPQFLNGGDTNGLCPPSLSIQGMEGQSFWFFRVVKELNNENRWRVPDRSLYWSSFSIISVCHILNSRLVTPTTEMETKCFLVQKCRISPQSSFVRTLWRKFRGLDRTFSTCRHSRIDLPQELTSTGRFGTSMSALRHLGL